MFPFKGPSSHFPPPQTVRIFLNTPKVNLCVSRIRTYMLFVNIHKGLTCGISGMEGYMVVSNPTVEFAVGLSGL